MASKDGYKRRQTNNDKSGTAKKVAASAAASSAKKAVEKAAAKGKAKAKTKASSGRTTAEKQRGSSVAENTAAAKIQQNRNNRKAEREKRRKERILDQQRALAQARKTTSSAASKGKKSAIGSDAEKYLGDNKSRTEAERERKNGNDQLAAYRAEKERNSKNHAEKPQGRLAGGIAGITEADKRSLTSASRKPRQAELPEGEVAETPFGRLMQKTFYSGLTTGLDSSVRGNLASGVNRLLGAPDPITDTVLKYSPAGIGVNLAKDKVIEPALKKLGEDTGIGDAAKKITDWRDKTQAKVTENLLNDKWTWQRDDFNQKLDEAVQKDGAGWRTAGSVGEAAGFLAPSIAAMMLTRNPAAAATRLEKLGKIGRALSKTFGHGSSAGTVAFGLQAKGSYMSQEYEMQKQKVFEDRIKAYETAVTQYNNEIEKINNRGSMTATEEAALSAREKELNKMYEELLTSERDGIDLTCAEILNAAKKADVTSDILALAEVGTEYLFGGIAGLGVGILDKPVNYVMGRIGRQMLSESTQKGLEQFAKSTAGKMLYNVKNYLGEAGEEAIMQVVQPYIERGAGDLDTANATMKEVAEAGGVGALLSMVLGVPGMAYHVGSRGVQKAQEIRLTGLRPKAELYSEEKLSDASRNVISSFAASEEGSVLRESAKNNERMTKDEVKDIFDDYLMDQGLNEKEEEAIREEIEASGGLSVALAVNMGIEPSRLGVSVKAHLKDLLSGKGDLAHRSDASEAMVNEQRIYTNAQEAVNDLVAQSKKAESGTDLVAYIADEHGNRSISLKAGESNVPIFRTTTIDAKTKARMDRMRNAKTETERTGLMYGVKDSVIAFAEEVSKGSGRKIIFDAGVGGGQLSQDQIANASYENGEIHINPNSKNPVARILAHELTHSIEGTAYYEQMKKLVFKYYRSSLTEAQANVKWTYEGQVKSIDDINSEVMAEFFEKKGITDMETLRSIVKENRSFAEKFVDWLNRIIQRITGTKEQRFLLKVRNQWKKALRETKEGIKNTPAEAGVETRKFSLREQKIPKTWKELVDGRKVKVVSLDDTPRLGTTAKERRQGLYESLMKSEAFVAPHYNKDTNTMVFISKLGISHSLKNMSKETLATLFHVDSIVGEAKFLGKGRKQDRNLGYQTYAMISAAQYSGMPVFAVKVIVKEYKIGSSVLPENVRNYISGHPEMESYARFYDASVVVAEIEEADDLPRVYPKSDDAPSTPASTISLAELLEPVKNELREYLPKDAFSDDARYSVSQKTDAAYMAAVRRGDMDEAQRMVDEAAKAAGYRWKKFHETAQGNNIHVFNLDLATHSTADYGTPYGIFTKSHDRTVGLGGKQMGLWVKADNTLNLKDRNEIRKALPKAYGEILDELSAIDEKYSAREEELEDTFLELLYAWFDEQPNGDSLRKQWDIARPAYEQFTLPSDVADAERESENLMAEWDEKSDRIIASAKEWITKWLPENGYDSMSLEYDNGAGNRVTDAFIVLKENQVKSADPVTYDDNGNVIPLSERFNEKQNDIRYSVAKTTDGRNCVFADSDILYKGRINGRTEVQAVADAIMSIVGNDYTVLSTGNVTYIGKDLPGEYLYSESAARLVKANKSIIKAKNLASGHLGELIEIAVNPKWQQNQKEKHGINAQRGWLRYDVRFAVPVLDKERKMTGAKIYDATLLVRMDADGKDYLYDMIGIKNSASSLVPSSLRKLIASWNKKQRPIGAPTSSAQRSAINNNSILDSSKDVNEKHSITKKSQRQAASAHDSVDSVKGKRLYLSDKRIEDIIERFGASNPHYSQALVTRISPSDFLWITTSSPDIIRSQTADINMEKLRSNEQTPYIIVDFETGEVIGHEGRHRIAALERAGARSVVITVIPQERGYDRNNAKLIDRMTVTGQFNKVKCTLHKLIPVNESRREDIEKEYGKRNIENRVSGIRYSISKKNEDEKNQGSDKGSAIGSTVHVKDWFMRTLQERDRHFFSEVVILKETEKAYFCEFDGETADGERDVWKKAWVPKSCTQTLEEYEIEERERNERLQKRFEEGKKAYEELVAWAKKNGVKGVRVGLRKETILKKIEEAGLTYDAEEKKSEVISAEESLENNASPVSEENTKDTPVAEEKDAPAIAEGESVQVSTPEKNQRKEKKASIQTQMIEEEVGDIPYDTSESRTDSEAESLGSGKIPVSRRMSKADQRQAASALVVELKESLGQRKAGQKELNALLKSIKDKILDTGAYSYSDVEDVLEQAKLIYDIVTASDRFVSFEQMDNEAEKEGAKPEELIYETMRKDIEDTFKSLARLNAYDEAKPQEKKEASKKNDAEKQRIKDEEGTMRTFDKIRAADRKQRIKEDQEALRLFDKLMREKDRNFEALDHSWKVKTARLVKKHKKELDKELERATKEVNEARDKREKEVAESYDKIIRDYERGRIKDEERALKLFDKILAEDEALALEFLEIGDFRNVDRVVAFYDRILKSERAKAETKRKAEEALKRREEVMKSRAKDRAAHKERMAKAKKMLRESNKAARANIPKGSRRDMYLKNRSSQKVAKGFVGDILNVLMRIEEGFLTENDISVIKNSKGQETEVVFDENGQILYERKPGMEHWDISTRINELTPGLALVYEAEQQGIDGDQFYTIYAALKGQVPDTPIKGLRNVTTKKAKQMRYINSLDLTARQKNFLYLDVCNFYSDGMPLFQDGGTNKAVKGNRRGRLARMLDEIALDMYAGNTIELKTVNDLVDLALGTERNEQWQKFHRFVMDEIVEASELMLKTKIITEMPVNSKKVKNKGGLKDEFRTLYSRFVAEGEGIETMGKHLDDPLLTARYYAAKASRSVSNEMIFGKSQRDLLGKEVGKSLNKIFKPIAGNEEKVDTLTKYCNYRHDIYRLKYDKGYTGLSVEELEERCRSIEKSDPDIVAIADEVVGYARNLLKMCVQANRISQADYEFFVERYPYYVPTFRVTVDEVLRDNKVKFRKIRVIKEAQGGSEELLPLFEQLVRRTHEMIKACKLNMLAQQIAMNARKPESRPFVEQPIPVEDTVKEDVAADIASMGAVEDVGQRTKERGFNNYIPWWSNGKQYNIPVTDEHVLYAWDRINYKIDENMVHKVLRNINNVRRGVLTQYSPTFPITNGIRDYFDMFIYNKHAHRLPKFHALALKGIFTRSGKEGEMFKEYMSYGASNASIFEYANTNAGKKPRYTKARAVFEKIDAVNFMIEQSPRFAVYLETVDRLEKQRKKGKNKYTDEEIKTIASYNAADATLNFGRSGTYIKAANTYGATFLNAGVQGADRLRRMFAQTAEGTLKEQILSVIGLTIKATLLGMAPNAIITVLWNSGIMRAIVGDDDYDRVKREFDEMSDFTKINYLVFWINGTWVKIPTGRALSWIYSHVYLTKEVLDGDMDPLDAIVAQVQNFAENILPANPVTNGILGPLVEVALNKNWMGYAIVDDWYKREDGFRYLEYDEDTTEAAKAIAAFGHYITGTIWGREDSRVLDLSPMKLDYLMQQYFGSYSGIVMPFLSGSQVSVSEKGYEALMSMAQKFYTDPVYSNRLANDYYTAKNYVDAVTEVYDGDTPYAVASDYFKEHGEKLKEIRDEIDAVNRNTNLSRKERKEKARELREQLNDLYREGLNGWKDILSYAMQNYDGKDRNKSTYNDAVGSVKGVEYSISTLSDTAQEQYKACSADGVSAEDFYDAYKFSQEVKSTRDANGKEVEGESKQDKVTAYLESRDASAAEKKSMWKNLFGYKSDPPAFSDGGSVSYNPGTAGSPILDPGARISSGYGPRNAPTAGASSYHRAIDIAAPGGTAVAAAMNGTVTRVSRSGGYGISVEVTTKGDDGNSYVTKYSHLLNTGVEVGQNVQKGVKIAEVDSTGTSTGNHLDFKLAINGDWVDPTQYLTAIGNGSLTDSGYSTKGGSGGGSRRSGGGSRKSGGSLGAFAVAGRENKATVKDVSDSDGGYTFSRQGSGTSGSSTVASSKPASNHAGTSTKNEKYASHGAYLPKASDSPYLPRYSDIASSNTRTKKTTRSNGRSMWDESVLG